MVKIICYREKFLGDMTIRLDKDSVVVDKRDTLFVDKATYTWIDTTGVKHRYRDFNRELSKERIL